VGLQPATRGSVATYNSVHSVGSTKEMQLQLRSERQHEVAREVEAASTDGEFIPRAWIVRDAVRSVNHSKLIGD